MDSSWQTRISGIFLLKQAVRQLPTKAVDNSVYRLLYPTLNCSFNYSFVKLYKNATICPVIVLINRLRIPSYSTLLPGCFSALIDILLTECKKSQEGYTYSKRCNPFYFLDWRLLAPATGNVWFILRTSGKDLFFKPVIKAGQRKPQQIAAAKCHKAQQIKDNDLALFAVGVKNMLD